MFDASALEFEVVGLGLATRSTISMSKGTEDPDRSNQRRIVSADDWGVVIKRICKSSLVSHVES